MWPKVLTIIKLPRSPNAIHLSGSGSTISCKIGIVNLYPLPSTIVTWAFARIALVLPSQFVKLTLNEIEDGGVLLGRSF